MKVLVGEGKGSVRAMDKDACGWIQKMGAAECNKWVWLESKGEC